MRKPGRKSAADQTTRPVLVLKREPPPPPAELSAAEAAVWTTVMRGSSGNWIGAEAHGLLCEFCAHSVLVAGLRDEIRQFDLAWSRSDEGQKHFNTLLQMHDRAVRLLTNLAVKLRIAPSARVHKETAGVLADKVQHSTGHVKPWDGAELD